MGEVIHVAFGTEREWEQTRIKLIEGLCTIGGLFGDDAALMEAKAEAVHAMLRQIVETIPTVQVHVPIPAGLSVEDARVVEESLRQATLAGIEAAMTHSVQVLMSGIYDLCTSKLTTGD